MSKRQEIIIFSDGACSQNPGQGGWAAIIFRFNENDSQSFIKEMGGFNPYTTNNEMELTAALNSLIEVKEENKKISLFTDSKYLVDGVKFWIPSWKQNQWKKKDNTEIKNLDLWIQIDKIFNYRKEKNLSDIDFIHIPGHQGIVGNERCDEIAVKFSKNEKVELFEGSYSEYKKKFGIDLMTGLLKNQKPFYISYIESNLENAFQTHDTWADCEKRVKGVKNAKFKKVYSMDEAMEVLKKWKNN
jgi:ribonuclease HI